jgi:tripartite ATP-independent transporter DctM subunit
VRRWLRVGEESLASLALLAMALLPLVEIAARRLVGGGVPGSQPIVQHLTLWVGFLGAALAARDDRLLTLATASFLPAQGRRRALARGFAGAVGAAVAILLALCALQLVQITRESAAVVAAGVPAWAFQLVLPFAFALVALRLAWRAGPSAPLRIAAAFGLAAGAALWWFGPALAGLPAWPGLVAIAAAAALGAPIFAILAGVASWLFLVDGVDPATILVETYALSVSPTLPAIPLFTLAGFLLAEGRSSERLLRVFRSCAGWLPGGTPVVCALLCSFFTVFTGGSGVTILALGGLLLPTLLRDGYRERFSIGLLTASGSLGLLLPPALPLIVYAVVAQVPIEDLFLGGIVPGLLMTALIAAWGVREGLATGAGRTPLRAREAAAALWDAKWELALPAVVLGALLSGAATAVESAALAALYALVVQAFVHRDLSLARDLPRVLLECAVLVGGVIAILGVAVGLTGYLVNARVPAQILEWTRSHVASRAVFLLGLNLFLLVVGCLMDIFSATVVVVPLIVPLAAAYGVDPVHLGIVFLANLELGYLTPPVGLNLFLASQRFERPVLEVARAALPMLAILGVGVLLVTYVPAMTLGLLALRAAR